MTLKQRATFALEYRLLWPRFQEFPALNAGNSMFICLLQPMRRHIPEATLAFVVDIGVAQPEVVAQVRVELSELLAVFRSGECQQQHVQKRCACMTNGCAAVVVSCRMGHLVHPSVLVKRLPRYIKLLDLYDALCFILEMNVSAC